jgi:hypothetical protein
MFTCTKDKREKNTCLYNRTLRVIIYHHHGMPHRLQISHLSKSNASNVQTPIVTEEGNHDAFNDFQSIIKHAQCCKRKLIFVLIIVSSDFRY